MQLPNWKEYVILSNPLEIEGINSYMAKRILLIIFFFFCNGIFLFSLPAQFFQVARGNYA